MSIYTVGIETSSRSNLSTVDLKVTGADDQIRLFELGTEQLEHVTGCTQPTDSLVSSTPATIVHVTTG